jgi:stage IV sporulation protein FB
MKFRFRIHPLFWILGIILTFLGEGFLFLAYIFTAVAHEYAHSVTAAFYKCRTSEMVLYPYGAVMYGEFSSLKPSEEAIVAMSGPCFNLFISVIFTALWWIIPELYVYTDILVTVNVSVAIFNLLPVYPLDGGRILMSLLKIKWGAKKAFKVVRLLGMMCCGVFAALYIISVFNKINYTLAVTAIFLFCSATDAKNCGSVEEVIFPPAVRTLKRGVEIKHLQVSGDLTLFDAIKLLSTQYYYVIHIIEDGKTVKVIKHEQLESIITKNGLHIALKDIRTGDG